MPVKTQPSPFARQINENLTRTVQRMKKLGTVGMSVDNLRQVTPTPSPTLLGAPKGTNAGYYYAQLFREVVAARKFRGFNIL